AKTAWKKQVFWLTGYMLSLGGGRAGAQDRNEAEITEDSSLLAFLTSNEKNCGKNLSNYWVMKSEPESRLEKGVDVKFSIEDLIKAQPKQIACWDGVRNYQAWNFLRAMKLEEEAFFYHSNCKQPGIMGLMKIVKDWAVVVHIFNPSTREAEPDRFL
uniref:Thymocyte nuclear protein 1 n=1 Tax=Peromyscus maniculatus bairdii TaxID=230844 RepID=A0A8C8U550_PERMB